MHLVPSRALLVAALVTIAPAAAGLVTASPSTAAASPSFVQQVSAQGHGGSLGVTPGSAISAGDRMVVEVGVWNSAGATASSVTDSAGNTYTELTYFKASDNTEMSIWTAPITAGGGTQAHHHRQDHHRADVGVAAVEYAGLSTATGTSVLDVQAHATGTTTTADTVTSGATPAATGGSELAIGFYADSGFGDTLTPAAGYASRVNLAPTPDMELLVEDQAVGQGATPPPPPAPEPTPPG